MKPAPAEMDPGAVSLLREAAEWRLMGLLFECPGEKWQAEVASLAAEVVAPDLRDAAAAARAQAALGLYHTALGPGGPAAPREVSHRETLVAGRLLAELRSVYEAFAYAPAIEEPPDHVAVEAGFVAYLRLKEAYARARGDQEQAAVAAQAARQFSAEHLRHVAEPLARTLASSGVGYLAQNGAALLRRVREALSR
ncbi:MAG: molecular chaperone TorD family protein [Planctomycetes bacterium]|nr:molecular chaperone TorD family protein [Planctomycetota bacterium]